jgi:hypothetical protein
MNVLVVTEEEFVVRDEICATPPSRTVRVPRDGSRRPAASGRLSRVDLSLLQRRPSPSQWLMTEHETSNRRAGRGFRSAYRWRTGKTALEARSCRVPLAVHLAPRNLAFDPRQGYAARVAQARGTANGDGLTQFPDCATDLQDRLKRLLNFPLWSRFPRGTGPADSERSVSPDSAL